MNVWQMLGSVFSIIYASLTNSNMMPSPSIYAVRNATGRFTTATALLSCASISGVISTNYNANMWDVESLS